jgi:hypothetical protein
MDPAVTWVRGRTEVFSPPVESKYQHRECHLGGVVVIVFAVESKGRGFNQNRPMRRIFKGYKNLPHTFFRMRSKSGGPVS